VNSLARAPSLPPEDVWYAGEPIRYYYGTQLQVLGFSMLTGTDPRYGFNLGIASFYGTLVVVAYGLAGAIVARDGHDFRLGGVLGVVFVALAGGTTTAIRLLTPFLPDAVADVVAPAAFGFVASRFYDGNLAQAVAERANPFEWSWWFTRYVVPGTLQEVPFYSFVKADLHGHALSTGYVLFAGAVAYAYYATPADARRRRATLLFGGLGAVAGVFGFMNTWALPTAGGLAVLAVAAADPHPATLLPRRYESWLRLNRTVATGRLRRLGTECWRLALAALVGLGVVAVGVAIASPFLIFGSLPTNEGIGLFPPRSPLGPFLVVYSGLLALFAMHVLVRARPVLAAADRRVLALGAMVVTTRWLDFAVLALIGPLMLGTWALLRSDRGDFALVLFVAGAGLLLSFELVYARLPLIDLPRWNTSLKVAVQGWTLAAAGAGAAAAMALGRYRDRTADGSRPTPRADPATVGTAALVVLVVLASLAFPVMAAGQATVSDAVQGEYNGTLDGHQQLEQVHSSQAAAVDWLDDRRGTPTIVEAPGSSYDWTSTASTFTGLPTVVGWDHQAEYRGRAAYERRVAHVDAIYTGPWPDASRYLDRYDVRYVYVGPVERDRYGDELRSFDRPAFTVAFESENVTIYAVDRSRLSMNGSAA
jgi:YYY domain-containing protein